MGSVRHHLLGCTEGATNGRAVRGAAYAAGLPAVVRDTRGVHEDKEITAEEGAFPGRLSGTWQSR